MAQFNRVPQFEQVPDTIEVGDYLRCMDINGFHLGRVASAQEYPDTMDSDGKPMLFLSIEWMALAVIDGEKYLYVEEVKTHLASEMTGYDTPLGFLEGFMVGAYRPVAEQAVA